MVHTSAAWVLCLCTKNLRSSPHSARCAAALARACSLPPQRQQKYIVAMYGCYASIRANPRHAVDGSPSMHRLSSPGYSREAMACTAHRAIMTVYITGATPFCPADLAAAHRLEMQEQFMHLDAHPKPPQQEWAANAWASTSRPAAQRVPVKLGKGNGCTLLAAACAPWSAWAKGCTLSAAAAPAWARRTTRGGQPLWPEVAPSHRVCKECSCTTPQTAPMSCVHGG